MQKRRAEKPSTSERPVEMFRRRRRWKSAGLETRSRFPPAPISRQRRVLYVLACVWGFYEIFSVDRCPGYWFAMWNTRLDI